jgi:hypothetical protein
VSQPQPFLRRTAPVLCSALPTRQSGADRKSPVRFPVFARRSNPAVDPPIVRKSLSYLQAQVCDGLADWVDSADPTKGIIAREILPRSEPVFLPEPVNPALPPLEVHGVHFEDPEKDRTKLSERTNLVEAARMLTYFGADKNLIPVES